MRITPSNVQHARPIYPKPVHGDDGDDDDDDDDVPATEECDDTHLSEELIAAMSQDDDFEHEDVLDMGGSQQSSAYYDVNLQESRRILSSIQSWLERRPRGVLCLFCNVLGGKCNGFKNGSEVCRGREKIAMPYTTKYICYGCGGPGGSSLFITFITYAI